MTIQVPSADQQYIQQASQGTGIPYNVVAAQVNAESGFQADVTSSAGAEGPYQFEPGTWASYGSGSEFNWADATAAYIKYMNTLLQDEGGNLQDALAAYNAGPGNISAGMSYANSILSAAGQGNETVKGGSGSGGTAPSTSSSSSGSSSSILDPSQWAPEILNSASSLFGSSSFSDLMERFGLIAIGALLIIVGFMRFTTSGQRITADTKKAVKTGAIAAAA